MIQNIELEQNILGCYLINDQSFHAADGILSPNDFSDPVHRDIFEIIQRRARDGELVSPVVLKSMMESHEGLKQLGGPSYLARLAGAAISVFAIQDHCKELREVTKRRNLKAVLEASIEELEGETPASHVAGQIEASLIESDDDNNDNVVSLMAATVDAAKKVSEAHAAEGVIGVTTGLADVDRMLGGFLPGELILLGGRPSMGKAQPLHAKVLTPTGFVKMGELRVGDKLASVDGGASYVTGIFPQGKKKVFRVTFADGRSVLCCGEHLWQVDSCKFKNARVIDTREIARLLCKERYRGRLHVPLFGGGFGEGTPPVDPWLLGFLLGDGSLTSGVKFSTPDAALLFRVMDTVGRETVKYRGKYDYAIATERGAENPLLTALRELGLIGCRSEEKFIPRAYLSMSRDVRLDLLRGLMDTDGWVEKHGAICYATSSKQLADDVQELVRSLGGVCSRRLKPTTHLDSHVLYIRLPDPSEAMTLHKKRERAVRKKAARNTIVSVDFVGVEECQCISVSHNSRLYVTDDYTVTHNTAVALSMALSAARKGDGVVIASLEMTPDSLAMRAIANEAAHHGNKIAYTDAKRGTMTDEQAEAFFRTTQAVAELPIHILPSNMRDMGAIYAGVKKAKRLLEAQSRELKLVVIDYLQLIQPSKQARSRVEQITEISIALKSLAMRMNVPVMALSQLSRSLESRDNKRPILSDLRESGQLEQDADTVMFCYRADYYLERDQPDESKVDEVLAYQEAMDAVRGKLEIIVSKQRMGAVGTVKVGFDPATNFMWDATDYSTA